MTTYKSGQEAIDEGLITDPQWQQAMLHPWTWVIVSDTLRIRLPVGAESIELPIELEYKAWDELDWSAWDKLTRFTKIEPICGWEWIKNQRHPIPIYNVELKINGSKQTITNAAPQALGEVIKIYRQAHKPMVLKPSPAAVYLAKHGMRVPA